MIATIVLQLDRCRESQFQLDFPLTDGLVSRGRSRLIALRGKNVKILIAAVSAPVHMNGVSRHAANLATALLQTSSVSELHFVAGSWQKEMFRRTCER